jgi:hypothetical protein
LLLSPEGESVVAIVVVVAANPEGLVMPIDHSEKAFESAIEHHLLTVAGYEKADNKNFDASRQIQRLLDILEDEGKNELRGKTKAGSCANGLAENQINMLELMKQNRAGQEWGRLGR